MAGAACAARALPTGRQPYVWSGDRRTCARRASTSPARHRADNVDGVINGSQSGWSAVEAERAFAKALRARRRALLVRRFLHGCVECARLAVVDAAGARGGGSGHGVRDIPLDAIVASLEPHRAAQFDNEFRPSGAARRRWLSVACRGAWCGPAADLGRRDRRRLRDPRRPPPCLGRARPRGAEHHGAGRLIERARAPVSSSARPDPVGWRCAPAPSGYRP